MNVNSMVLKRKLAYSLSIKNKLMKQSETQSEVSRVRD
jgi:hypothetical protein